MPNLVEQAVEMACSASTKTQMAHMKGGTATEKNLHSYFFRCTVTICTIDCSEFTAGSDNKRHTHFMQM